MATTNTTEPFDPIIGNEELAIVQIINYTILSGLVCLMGTGTNIINLIIYYKQGLSNTMNISFFAIAISDICSLIPLEIVNIFLNPYMLKADVPFEPNEIQYLTGGWPHACFARVTCWITVFVTIERCLCITIPLKVKQIITPARTRIVVCMIYFIMALSVAPEYVTYYFGWKFNSALNRTRVGLVPYQKRREQLEGFAFILYAFISFFSFLTIIFFTVLLVVKLQSKTKWRERSMKDKKRSENISSRDKKAVKMVVLIACVLIASYTPSVILYVVVFIVPEFSLVGKYQNVFHACWSVPFLTEAINSSVNIFLYYKMSSKYRETFHTLFRCFKNRVVDKEDKSEVPSATKYTGKD